MAVFKCKMCGGALEVNNETVATCSYCGTQQTLPKLDDEKKAQLYDRANYFRRENEFDKAMGIYEMILSDEKTDSEAYWGIVLCRYGIEYVEDPRSRRRIPTVNRAQFTSVFDDVDYKRAIENADSLQRGIYEAEAGVIDMIQKGILALSSKEEPFDIFICYKETDNQGNRTQDSVYAQDIYNALVKEGYKVFFSRITLEDKLGSAYEPYIFAALNSAKVMLVVGTSKDNFNAVWVKNEWSRFISLIKAGKEKTLIPLYKDMSPYDMPEEFQYLQSQDMSKIGYIQDVVHGVKKLVEANKATVKEAVVVSAEPNSNINALLKRGFMELDDNEWSKADNFFEQCLNQNAELAEAYLGKLMAELHVTKLESLRNMPTPFDDRNNYQKVLRFADDSLKGVLIGYVNYIKERNENTRLEGIYNQAKFNMSYAKSESEFLSVVKVFDSIGSYRDSFSLAQECREKAEIERKDGLIKRAKHLMENDSVYKCEYAIELLKPIESWKDAKVVILACQNKIEEIKVKEEAQRLEYERKVQAETLVKEKKIKIREKIKNIFIFIAFTIFILLLFVVVNKFETTGFSPVQAEEIEFSSSLESGIDVYADIVSIQPTIGTYYGGSSAYNNFVCKCKTSSGSTMWVFISVSNYKQYFDSEATGYLYVSNVDEIEFDEPIRIHGYTQEADDITKGLSSDIGTSILFSFESTESDELSVSTSSDCSTDLSNAVYTTSE